MKKLIALIFAGVCVLGAYAAFKSSSSSSSSTSTPRPSQPAPAATVAAPKPEPQPTPEPTKPVESSLDDQMKVAAATATDTKKKLADAKAACLTKLASSPDYARAKAEADRLEAEVKTLRAANDTSKLATISPQWIAAKGKRMKLEADALDGDPATKAAASNLASANADVMAIQSKINAVKAEEDAKIASAARKIKVEADRKAEATAILQKLMDHGIVTSYDKDGNVRVDPLAWLPLKRDQKELIVRAVKGAYAELGIPTYFSVMSDRNDTEFASVGMMGGITIKM
jgi:hypothetical protein